MHFNDASKIFEQKDSKSFTIVKREKNEQGQRVDTPTNYTFDYFPDELEKKVDLFKTFAKYLNKDSNKSVKQTKLTPAS